MAAHLAKACGCMALSIDYRMAPEHTFPAAHEDCVAAYKWLLDRGFSAGHIALAGDSCGGGLATTVALLAIQKGYPAPACSVSISPWYDKTCSGKTMTTNEQNDALSEKEFVGVLAKRYAPDTPLTHELLSPLFAKDSTLEKLPPHWISAAGYDILLDDAERMAEKLKQCGVEVVLEVHEGQQHVMEFMAGKAPEAIDSFNKIGKWVKSNMDG
jgi:epsilon-lactone hydrolase